LPGLRRSPCQELRLHLLLSHRLHDRLYLLLSHCLHLLLSHRAKLRSIRTIRLLPVGHRARACCRPGAFRHTRARSNCRSDRCTAGAMRSTSRRLFGWGITKALGGRRGPPWASAGQLGRVHHVLYPRVLLARPWTDGADVAFAQEAETVALW